MVDNDLDELKGIGPKHAQMLKDIGVDSIKELRHRNAAKLKEMIETRHGKVVGLSENTCQTCIDEDKVHKAGPQPLGGTRQAKATSMTAVARPTAASSSAASRVGAPAVVRRVSAVIVLRRK